MFSFWNWLVFSFNQFWCYKLNQPFLVPGYYQFDQAFKFLPVICVREKTERDSYTFAYCRPLWNTRTSGCNASLTAPCSLRCLSSSSSGALKLLSRAKALRRLVYRPSGGEEARACCLVPSVCAAVSSWAAVCSSPPPASEHDGNSSGSCGRYLTITLPLNKDRFKLQHCNFWFRNRKQYGCY